MSKAILDGVENLLIDPAKHANEVRTLQMLQQGLMSLATGIKRREHRYAEIAKTMKFSFFGGTTDEEVADLNLVSCIFHWFGVSVCNYARLVGFIRGLEKNQFTRTDLKTPAAFKGISSAVKTYVESIPELAQVLVWRNKVGGHFAITDPRSDDNIATLNMSVMFQVSLENGVYVVGGYSLTQGNSTASHTSAIPMWSVSQVFESLIPRFWPNVKFATDRHEPRPSEKPDGATNPLGESADAPSN